MKTKHLITNIIFLCFIGGAIHLGWQTHYLKMNGLHTTGEVIRAHIVEFTTEQKEKVQITDLCSRHKGDQVPVIYFADNPQGSARVEHEDMLKDWDAPLSYILAGVFFLFLARIFSRRDSEDAAEKFGVDIDEVERETPVLDDDGNFESMTKDRCIKYSLSRPDTNRGDWALLQRFPDKDTRLPNGYVVVASVVTASLLEALRPLAEKYNDDYYEFERTGDILSAFCSEDSEETMKKLHKTLVKLDA